MAGNAGTQTLAVMVRQISLGDIDEQNSKDAIKKEVLLSLFNGMIFAFLLGLVAFVWFDNAMLGVVIALSMIITLFCAGFFGAAIPLLLKKLDVDPAIGSSVLLTTVTDVIGFFSFLSLAKLLLI
jgi:magnesium transporter